MADLFSDFLIYIGIGVVMFVIGLVIGSQILTMYYNKRFLVIANDCSDSDSVIPIVDELARET